MCLEEWSSCIMCLGVSSFSILHRGRSKRQKKKGWSKRRHEKSSWLCWRYAHLACFCFWCFFFVVNEETEKQDFKNQTSWGKETVISAWVWCQMLQKVLGYVVCFCLHATTENGWSMVSLCMQMKCSCVSDFECWTMTCGWEAWPNGLGKLLFWWLTAVCCFRSQRSLHLLCAGGLYIPLNMLCKKLHQKVS